MAGLLIDRLWLKKQSFLSLGSLGQRWQKPLNPIRWKWIALNRLISGQERQMLLPCGGAFGSCVVSNTGYHSPRITKSTPMMHSGIPAIAPTTVMVRITPASLRTRPKITATILQVSITIYAIRFHIHANGHSSQWIFLVSIMTYS